MKQAIFGWIMLALGAVPVAASAEDGLRLISVTGTGDIAAAPDMATVRVGVAQEDREAAQAMQRASDSAAAVLARLEAAGIAARDVQTGTVSLTPVWSGSRNAQEAPRITGFAARISVTVRVRDLTALGSVLDAVVRDGANELGGISFGFQDPDPMMDEARRRAVADGRAKATLLAEAAGVTLGPLHSMSEHGGAARPMAMEMAAARDAGVPIAAGEMSLSASVSMVYQIAE